METLLRAGLGNAASATLLALVVAVLVAVGAFRRAPALRHVLWLLVLLKLVTPTIGWVPVAWPEAAREARPPVSASPEGPAETVGPIEVVEEWPADAPAPIAEVRPAADPPQQTWSISWEHAVGMAWLVGSALTFSLAATRVRRFRRLLRLASPLAGGQVDAVADRLGLARAPGLWSVPGDLSPMLWSIGGAPRLIVPAGLWARLDDRQRATLLAHELAHLRRRDHWVRGFELFVTGLYWWLPTAWLARRALREAEEQCCDAWVVWALPDAARTYAETLLQTVDFLSGAGPAVPVAASGLGHVHHLKRRLIMIMQGTNARTLSVPGVLLALGLSAALLPFSPTLAQDPGADAPRLVLVPQPDENPATVTVFVPDGTDPKKDDDEAIRARALDYVLFTRGQAARTEVEAHIDRAGGVSRLVEQLKALLKDLDQTNSGPVDVARRDQVRKLIRDLEEAIKSSDGAKSVRGDLDDDQRREFEAYQRALHQSIQAKRKPDAPGSTPDQERSADEVRKVHAEIEALRAKVQEKRAEMRELEASLARAVSRLNGMAVGQPEFGRFKASPRVVREYRLQRPAIPTVPKPLVGTAGNPDVRIDALEKRLEQLMDEVKSLKKDQEPKSPDKPRLETR